MFPSSNNSPISGISRLTPTLKGTGGTAGDTQAEPAGDEVGLLGETKPAGAPPALGPGHLPIPPVCVEGGT